MCSSCYHKNYVATNLENYEKRKRRAAQWIKDNPDRARELHTISTYNVDRQRFDSILAAQNGMCALCPRPLAFRGSNEIRAARIDHDHSCCPGDKSCGKCIRGLLCDDCNRGLGSFRDCPAVLRAAAGYIEKFIQQQEEDHAVKEG